MYLSPAFNTPKHSMIYQNYDLSSIWCIYKQILPCDYVLVILSCFIFLQIMRNPVKKYFCIDLIYVDSVLLNQNL